MRKNISKPRKQIIGKNDLANSWKLGGHVLEFNINEMISLEYQLKVVLNSG